MALVLVKFVPGGAGVTDRLGEVLDLVALLEASERWLERAA